jgi:hypothetical protein
MEMEAAPKRARAGGGEAPDRFSALPDELLRRVLSFLPSRQAVQTTVLSERWIDLWRLMPAIDLNIREFKCRSPAPGQYEDDVGKDGEFHHQPADASQGPAAGCIPVTYRFN